MDDIFKNYNKISHLNVSRETCLDFEEFISMILKKNKEINIVSKNTGNNNTIRDRHIIDSAQIIDFVDFNTNTICDLGSGGGFPGIVIAIMLKNMNKKLKVKLFEKSYHKSEFLRDVSKKLNLDTEIVQKDIFSTVKVESGTIISRAFKPLPVVLELVHKNFNNYKNLILFMGKSGKKILEETLKHWNFDYEEKESITSQESFLLNIRNIRR